MVVLKWNHRSASGWIVSSSRSANKWIVKDAEGKIYGPFTTEQVLEQIDRNYFLGGEQVASYPGGNWIPISKAPEFYDRLLDVLAAEVKGVSNLPTGTVVDQASLKNEPTPIGASQPTKTGPSAVTASLAKPSKPGEEDEEVSKSSASIIELTDLKWLERKERIKSSRVPIAVIGIAVFVALMSILISQDGPSSDRRIHLLAPRSGQAELSEARIREKYQTALNYFYSDTFQGYERAQNELVELIEGSPMKPEFGMKKAELLATLCLVYRELWPFAFQDSRDIKTMGGVMQEAKKYDPGGINGGICEVIQLVVSGRFRDAQGLTESLLLQESQHPVLFEIRGELYTFTQDHASAVSYFHRAAALWGNWKKIQLQEARSRAALKQFPQAIQIYRKILNAVPAHNVARIELGRIEGLQFQHYDRGIELLKSALDSASGKERVPRAIESLGYSAMAKIYQLRNNRGRALEYAKKAFTLDPTNNEAKALVTELAGKAPEKDPKKLRGAECMYLGDQYLRAGDCFAAQGEFKACYEADNKNAVAAMKAGKCLWQLNQAHEAIDWLNKAIKADQQLTAAYVELADYHAQRFDYLAAAEILRRIQQLQPQSFEVYRGYATVELRRNNFKGAISFGNRAMKLYESDLQMFLIMAKAYIGLQSFDDARKFASRAIELDFNSTEAHSLLAKAEAGLHGIDAGTSYMQQMINRYIITKGQQVPQAAIDFRVTLGEIYMQDERHRQAEEAFRQAVSLDSRNKKGLVNLGKALQAQNQGRAALEYFLQAAVLDPSDAEPIFLSGQLYAETGKPAEAIQQFERVLRINPKYPKAHIQRGWVQMKLGEPKAALEEAMKERNTNPDIPDSYLLAAEAYFKLKQYSNCAAEFQRAVQKKGQGAIVLVKMARCYRLAGALDSAVSLLRQARTIESGIADIYKEQGAIFHMKGMADEAIGEYDTYLRLSPNAADRPEIEARMRKVQQGDLTPGE